jgi:hypothetical protein
MREILHLFEVIGVVGGLAYLIERVAMFLVDYLRKDY